MGRRRANTLIKIEQALLRELAREPSHTYALARTLERDRYTVADAVKRLDGMGLVRGKWDTGAGRPGPPRRVYTLTAKGRREHAKITTVL